MRAFASRVCTLAFLLALGATPSAHAAASSFETGFWDGAFTVADPLVREAVFGAARSSGAEKALLSPGWAYIAPARRPAGFDPSNPADPAYRWDILDRAVHSGAASGMEPIFMVKGAPAWAEGPDRPTGALPGTWRPDPAELAAFLTAAARRYSGSFPDPQRLGLPLPRIAYWQIWGEQNLGDRLSPQWVRRNGRLVPFAPAHYRRMLRAAYQAIKAVQPDAVIATGGGAPFGDLAPSSSPSARMSPVTFLRHLLCLHPSDQRSECRRDPALFDVLAHHPYAVGAPRRAALNRNDVTIPDLSKLTRVLREGNRARTVAPSGTKSLWVTEFSWDSSPPDPDGVPEPTRARWISEALYLFWRQGVELVVWFQVRDAAPKPSFGASAQSGVFYRSGREKLGQTSFLFPFAGERRGRYVSYWGRSPGAGTARIQRKTRRGWRTLERAKTRSSGVFTGRIRLRGSGQLRAVVGRHTSLAWAQR